MKVHELQIKSKTDRKRVGRGIGSGTGKTAGRGTKGQWARSGGGVRLGFEGGQNPLSRRLPKKRGFTPLSRVIYQVVNFSDLERVVGQVIDGQTLLAAGLIKYPNRPIKVLGNGELKKKLTIKVTAASKQAQVKIEQAGGTLELVPVKPRASKPKE